MKEIFIGQKFQRLTIIKELEPLVYVLKHGSSKGQTRKARRYLCQCSCGRTTKSRRYSLMQGLSRSCGCLRADELSIYPIGRKEKGASYLRYMFGYYTRNARRKGTPFTLTGGQFANLVQQNCFYCGEPPVERKNRKTSRLKNVFHGTAVCNGIDRLNPALGYAPNNCVACCKICNIAKHTMSVDEFMSWIERVGAHTRLRLRRRV